MSWIIGKSIERKDALEKVTGVAKYTADFSSTDRLHVKLVVSTHAHAKLTNIDTAKAWKVPGVRAIVLGDAAPLIGDEIKDRPILAYNCVRYHGEPIAAVVADTPFQAKQAAELIQITYTPLTVVNSPRDALRIDAPLLHESLGSYEKLEGVYPEPGTNVANRVKIRKGNIDQAFQGDPIIVEESFSLSPSDHTAMETRCATVMIRPDKIVEITSATQAPYRIKEKISEYFNIDAGKIIVTVPYVGGGFGGKVAIHLELIAYLASKAVGGRLVELLYTREEDMITSPCRIGLDATIKLAATKDGQLTGAKIHYLFDSGAYSDKGTMLCKAAAATCTGPYKIDHIWCDSLCIYTNHPYATAYRGFSHSELLFAFERTMDILARKLNMDPLELRRKNMILPGHISPTQIPFNSSTVGNLPACIDKLEELMDWHEGVAIQIDETKVRAKGIVCSWKTSTIGSSSSASSGITLLFNPDGSINILSGIVEIGMGTKTMLAQLLAEKLKMNVEKIHVHMEVNTQTTPEHYKTVASRGTLMAGRALLKAAEDVIHQLKNVAGQVLICSPDDLEVRHERVYVRDEPDIFVDIKDICYGYEYPNGYAIGGQIIGRGTYTLRHLTKLDPATGAGKAGPEYTVGAQGVEVEFDTTDYTYRIVKAYSVIDAGKVIHSKAALGQVMGGMSMGLNHASTETFMFNENGIVKNPRLRTYGSFRYGDHPDYVVHFLETPHIDGPFGARGVGEIGLIGMAAALANSLSVAANVELNKLPLTPEYIWHTKKAVTESDCL